MKKAEHDTTGGERINDAVDVAGWGVEEAEMKHKAEASTLSYAIPNLSSSHSYQILLSKPSLTCTFQF
jgi:hypothetical protein